MYSRATLVFGKVNYLKPMDTRQYLYCLTPKAELYKDNKVLKGVTSIGKLDIVWRTNLGERGRLQTSQLQRVVSKDMYHHISLSFVKYLLLFPNGVIHGVMWWRDCYVIFCKTQWTVIMKTSLSCHDHKFLSHIHRVVLVTNANSQWSCEFIQPELSLLESSFTLACSLQGGGYSSVIDL